MLTIKPFRMITGVLMMALSVFIHPAPSAAQKPFTCEDQFFLTLSSNPTSLNEVLIDPQTNVVVFKNLNANIPFNINAAGFRIIDNLIYCLNPILGTLIRIDANGQAQTLANLPLNLNISYFAGDVTPDGKYLVVIGTGYPIGGLAQIAEIVLIDLELPGYPITTISVNRVGQIFDIAYHPVTGELYGYDSFVQRLVRIDPLNGAFFYDYPASGVPFNSGSLFFDAYGRLFAYGSPTPTTDQNQLYQIDPVTGVSKLLFNGPPAVASDGCSCPYTIILNKTVSANQIFPCTDVEYTFEIVNTSNRPHEGIRLEDQLPPGFTFVKVVSNPVGGNVTSQPGDSFFAIEDMDLSNGKFEIKILVNTGPAAPGIYRNQAVLYNLPAALGGKRVSDNPATPIKDDSTMLIIRELAFDSIFLKKALCEGVEVVSLDASSYGASIGSVLKYTWQDGSTGPVFDVTTPGNYWAMLTAGCDTAYVFYEVVYSSISLELLQNEGPGSLQLGDSLYLRSEVINTSDQTFYQWMDPQPGSVRCLTCPETWVRPFNDITYTLRVENELGCFDSATVQLTVAKNKRVYFPNVFNPDAENVENTFFYPSGDRFTRISNLAVFSRWGEKIFEAMDVGVNDMNAGWDGTHRGQPMLPGVYVWVATIAFLDGESVTYSGDVTLVR